MKTKTILLFIIYLFFHIAINIIHPVTPDYVIELKLNDFYFALLFAIMSFGQVIGSIISGRLSDKYGKRGLIIIGILGYGFFQFCFGFFNKNIWIILLFRFGSGFFVAAPVALFINHLIDITPIEKRNHYLNIFSMFQILGIAFGYFIGGFIFSDLNLTIKQVFLFQTLFVASLILITLLFFWKKDVIRDATPSSKMSLQGLKDLKGRHILFFIAICIATTGYLIILKFADRIIVFYYNASTLGTWTLVAAIGGIIGSIIFIPFINKAKNKLLLLYEIISIFSILFVCLTFAFGTKHLIILLFTTFLLFNIFRILSTPVEQAYIASLSNASNRGTIMGIRHAFISLGNMAGPLIGAIFYGINKFLTFYVGSLAIFIAFIIILFIYLRQIKQFKIKRQEINSCL